MENTPSVAISRRRNGRVSFNLASNSFMSRMGIAKSFGFAQADAVNHARMIQGVADHGVSFIEQDFEEASVRIEAGTVEDGVVGAEKRADRALEFFVDVLRSANEAHRGHAIAVSPKPVGGRLDDSRMIGQAQVVVGAEVQDTALCDLRFLCSAG